MLEQISFLVFILVIALLIYRDRKNIKLEGIMIIRRTEKGRKLIDMVAKKYRRFWKVFAILGVIFSVPAMIISSGFIITNAAGIIQHTTGEAVSLVLPGAVSNVEQQPGLLILPWWLWVIGIFSVLIPHEFSHGIMSRLDNIKIKSLGWLLLLFLPGAFCEPDEKQLRKASILTRLKVYAAGSFANMSVALIFFLLAFSIFNVAFGQPCMGYSGVIEGYPFHNAGVSGCIFSINNIPVTTPDQLSEVLSKIEPGSAIDVSTNQGQYSVRTASNPNNGTGSFVGISGPYYTVREPAISAIEPFAGQILLLGFIFSWIFILNLGIGMVNLLPIKPFDGGMILEDILSRFTKKKKAKKISTAVSIIMALVLIFNIIGPYIV